MLNFHQSLPFLNWLFPSSLSRNIFPQDFSARFSARISRKMFPQEFPAKFSRKIFVSWILIGWLPITLFQMLNFHQSLSCEIGLLIIKVPKCPHHPFPKSYGNPKSMNKLTLNEPAKNQNEQFWCISLGNLFICIYFSKFTLKLILIKDRSFAPT